MGTFAQEAMRAARQLARLERLARTQRAALKNTEALIRKTKKDMRVLVAANTQPEDWQERGAASKVMGLPAGGAKR